MANDKSNPSVKLNIKGLDAIESRLIKVIKDTEKDTVMLSEVGDRAVKFIKGNVLARRDEYKVKDVGSHWASGRAVLANFNTTAKDYIGSKVSFGGGKNGQTVLTNRKGRVTKSAVTKSNLTFTGQFMESLSFKQIRANIELFFDGVHKPYKDYDGTNASQSISNAEIAARQAEAGRKILLISERLKPILKNIVIRNVRRRISLYQRLKASLNKS